jgi:hypothetical protein
VTTRLSLENLVETICTIWPIDLTISSHVVYLIFSSIIRKCANADGELLQTGQTFRFDFDATPGTNRRVMLPHPEIIEASERGLVLLVDDGKISWK